MASTTASTTAGFEVTQSIRMVLYNHELLETILQHLTESKQTLFSASLTSKAFSEPSFNVLWYKIQTIWPLFCILPTFERLMDGKYLFTGPVRNEHLQRVLYYAKRIRFLDYKDIDNSPYSSPSRDLIISTFMKMDKLGAFFLLRKIHLHDPSSGPMLLPATLPNLESIVITKKTQLVSTEIEFASFLRSVVQSPFLRTLAIEGSFSDITLTALPDFLNLCRLIIWLDNSDIPVHFLKRSVSLMPSLQHLRIHIVNCRFAQPNEVLQGLGHPHSTFRLSLPSLETLYVGCNSTDLENLLGVLDAPLLKSTSLALLPSTVSACMDRFIEMNRQVLKDKVHRAVIKSIDPSIIVVESFENLRELTVSSSHGTLSMSDIVHTFTYHALWSRSLVHLQLMQSNPCNPLDCLSIAALWFIADACPNLKLLKISIHRPDEPGKQIVGTKERKPHNLKKLVFLNLPNLWGDTTGLAIELVSLLDYLFPSMVVPDYTGGAIDKRGTLARRGRRAWWKSVRYMYQMVIKDRKQESQAT